MQKDINLVIFIWSGEFSCVNLVIFAEKPVALLAEAHVDSLRSVDGGLHSMMRSVDWLVSSDFRPGVCYGFVDLCMWKYLLTKQKHVWPQARIFGFHECLSGHCVEVFTNFGSGILSLVNGKCCKAVLLHRRRLMYWYGWQPFEHASQSLCKFDHLQVAANCLDVARAPGWWRLCIWSELNLWKPQVTSGRGCCT